MSDKGRNSLIYYYFLYKTKELKKNINYFSRKEIANVRDKKEE